jgi:hypothetical protein
MPFQALRILLFCKVILLKYPAVPKVAASEINSAVAVFEPFVIIVFLSVTFVMGVEKVEPIKNTVGPVAEVFAIVRFMVVPPAVFEPSMMVLLFKTLKRAALARDPEIEAVTPVFGLMVMVLVGLEPSVTGTMIGQVSPAEL